MENLGNTSTQAEQEVKDEEQKQEKASGEQVTEEKKPEDELLDTERAILKFFEGLDRKGQLAIGLFIALDAANGYTSGTWKFTDRIWEKFRHLDNGPWPDQPGLTWFKGMYDAIDMLNHHC